MGAPPRIRVMTAPHHGTLPEPVCCSVDDCAKPIEVRDFYVARSAGAYTVLYCVPCGFEKNIMVGACDGPCPWFMPRHVVSKDQREEMEHYESMERDQGWAGEPFGEVTK